MKLGELRGAIRKFKGNPIINLFPVANSDLGMKVSIQKTSLLEELERVYPGGKSVETGLAFNSATGVLSNPEVDAAEGLTSEQKADLFAGTKTTNLAPGETVDEDGVIHQISYNDPDDVDLSDDDLDLDDIDDLDLDLED